MRFVTFELKCGHPDSTRGLPVEHVVTPAAGVATVHTLKLACINLTTARGDNGLGLAVEPAIAPHFLQEGGSLLLPPRHMKSLRGGLMGRGLNNGREHDEGEVIRVAEVTSRRCAACFLRVRVVFEVRARRARWTRVKRGRGACARASTRAGAGAQVREDESIELRRIDPSFAP